MKKIKSFVAMILCGVSTFSIFPGTNYSDYYTHDGSSLTFKAWCKTGENLRKRKKRRSLWQNFYGSEPAARYPLKAPP